MTEFEYDSDKTAVDSGYFSDFSEKSDDSKMGHDTPSSPSSSSSSGDEDSDDEDEEDEDEDELPSIILNQAHADETGVEPRYWFADEPVPDLAALNLDERDIARLCRELNINPRTGMVGLNFRTDSPFWGFRCEFAWFYRAWMEGRAGQSMS